jgi:thiol-disulfide isomerase/thioredoxin
VFTLARSAGKDISQSLSSEIVGLKSFVNDDLPQSAAGAVTQYLTTLNDLGDKVDSGVKKAVRGELTHMYEASIAKAKDAQESPNKQRQIDSLETTLKYVNGAFMRGELLDHPAPAMTFLWSSTDSPIKSLDQFKGKVVVLDFWATWCGPCRASFPDIAELKSHYEGYDVVVIGITSPQGYHIDKDHKKVDTAGHPEKEFELMPGFMKDMGMTWTVAFTQDNVFNPEFGVRGIPHMAIIDPAGKVRYNGLHPAAVKLKEKAEKIDGLLKEAHLPTPAPVTASETDKKSDKGG